MKLVALKNNVVVAIEDANGIDSTIENDKIMSVDNDVACEVGWEYTNPIKLYPGCVLFVYRDPNLKVNDLVPIVYAEDENGNQYVVENPEELE